MKKKQLITILVALIVVTILIVAYVLVQKQYGSDSTEDESETTVSYSVLSIDANTLERLTVTHDLDGDGTQETYAYSLLSDATGWYWEDDTEIKLDNTYFTKMVNAVTELTSSQRVENVSDENLSTYGLNSPTWVMTYTDESGAVTTFTVGKLSPYNGKYYCRVNADTTLYMVSSSVLDEYAYVPTDMVVYDDLPEMTDSQITSVTFNDDNLELLFRHYAYGNTSDYTSHYTWYFTENGTDIYPMSNETGDALTKALTGLSYASCVSFHAADRESYGIDKTKSITISYTYTYSVTDSETSETTNTELPATLVLYYGDLSEDGLLYVCPSDADSTYTYVLDGSVFATLLAGTEDSLRASEILLADATEVSALTLTTPNVTHSYSVSDDSEPVYSLDGVTIEYETFEPVMTALLSLTADALAKDVEKTLSGDVLFKATVTLTTGSQSTLDLVVTSYSDSYAAVSFAGYSDRLITVSQLEELTAAVEALPVG